MSAAIVAAGVTAAAGAYGSNQSAKRQSEAANRAAGISEKNLVASRELQKENLGYISQQQAPFYNAGVNALQKMQSGNPMEGMASDPGYQFRLQQGQQALDRASSARGGMGSGRYLKDAMGYNQGMASQEYGNYFNRLNTMAGIGQHAADTWAGAIMGDSAMATNSMTGNSDNQMNAQLASGQARAGAYSGYANAVGQLMGSVGGGGRLNPGSWLGGGK